MKFAIEVDGVERTLELQQETSSRLKVQLDGKALDADAAEIGPDTFSLLIGGSAFEARILPGRNGLLIVHCRGREFQVQLRDPRAWRGRRSGVLEAEGRQQVTAPMPGKVVRVLVAAGETVEAGQGLVVVEAMKMQNEIRSPKSGKVERLLVREGQNVIAGEVLAWVE
jgi:biotin carboxyl carrier protein